MADAILFSLSLRSADQLHVRCDANGRSAEATHALPEATVIADLLFQIRDGNPSAGRALCETLGAALFGGAPGALARTAMTDGPQIICLEAEEAFAHWPWEMALDPETGRCPVVDGLAMVRIGGPVAAPTHVPKAGVIVSPSRDRARADALDALTHNLGRKGGLAVARATPASLESVRDLISEGAAFVHLDSPAADGRVVLDDAPATMEALGLDANTWLAVIGGNESGARTARAAREAGAQVVIGRQIALDPQHAAALDRKLYQSLTKGLSPIDAIRAARAALVKRDAQGYAWAAPVLWSVRQDARLPAAVPFPPQAVLNKAVLNKAVSNKAVLNKASAAIPAVAAAPVEVAGATPSRAPPRHAINALSFIGETIEQLQLGGQPTDPALAARLDVLRQLGGDAGGQPPRDLSHAARIDWIADRLLDGLDYAPQPLHMPANAAARAAQVALGAGARVDDALALTHALVASPVVALEGDGAEQLAQAVADQLFEAHLSRVVGQHGCPLVGGPGLQSGQVGDGWLYHTASLNWRLNEDWSPQPSAQPPTQRLPVMARTAANAWRVFEAAWLLCTHTDRFDAGALDQALAALNAGVLTGFDRDGMPFQLDLPPDFRVLLVGAKRSQLPEWVPIVQVTAPVQRAHRWLDSVAARLGPCHDAAESSDRSQLAAWLDPILGLYSAITGAPSGRMGEAALRFALTRGGPLPGALDAALVQLLAPRLSGAARGTLCAWLAGDPDGMVEAADAAVTRGLARYLDAIDPTSVPRLAALDQLGPLALVTEPSLAAPDVTLPRLLAALGV
ncbi:MAG: hypothetical protein ACI9U2_004388 [Bradymonadia bacterium]